MTIPPEPIDVPGTETQAVETTVLILGGFLVVYLLGSKLVAPAVAGFFRARNRSNPTLANVVERYVRLAALVLAIGVAAAFAGYGHVLSNSAIVIAAATLAIGVAGQEVIGDLVSGLFLAADPEFNVGDWISWEGGEGTVETVRFRVTRVRTPNNEVITVPNTVLATGAVTRPYSREQFRVVVRIGIATDEDVDEAIAAFREEMTATEGVLDDPAPNVVVDEIDLDATWIRAEFWTDSPSRLDVDRVRSNYVRNLKARLEREGIAFSPPADQHLSGRLTVEGTAAGESAPR